MNQRLLNLTDEVIETDVLIVGSEGAGARAAIEASKYDVGVTIVTKGRMGKCGATVTAGGDVSVDSKSCIELLGMPGNPKDSKEAFLEDVILEGRFVNDQRLAEALVNEAGARVKELVDWGMIWARDRENPFHAAGHMYPRGVWTSGFQVMKALKGEVQRQGNKINLIEDTMVTDLLTHDGQVVGATALNLRTGKFIVLPAKAVVLAAGGGLRVYQHTTACDDLSGDGQAMAYRAGAELIDMQYIQFVLITPLRPPLSGYPPNFLLMYGPWLINDYGQRFLTKWDPEKIEQTTRDNICIGIGSEILEGRKVYFSMKHLPDNVLDEYSERFGKYFASLNPGAPNPEKAFFDNLKRNAIPIMPGCHFWIGGIRTNVKCETQIPGLYAAGEVTGGCHGANRLSGCAVTEILVFGQRAGKFAAEYASKAKSPKVDAGQIEKLRSKVFRPIERKEGIDASELRQRLKKLAYEKVGAVRDGPRLESAIMEIERIRKKELPEVCAKSAQGHKAYNREWLDALQVENIFQTVEMIARSALMRTESRGCHYRRDYPAIDNRKWLNNTILRQVDGEMMFSTEPIATISLGKKIMAKAMR